MKRPNHLRPMLVFALFLQIFIACSREELAFADEIQQDTTQETADKKKPDAGNSQNPNNPNTSTSTDNTTTPEGPTTNPAPEQQPISDAVMFWKNQFDREWNEPDSVFDKEDAMQKSLSGNKNQEYYYLGYYIDGLTQIWQATGDNSYLDTALELITNTINDAVPVANGFLGWPAHDGIEYALWDSFYWRHVATLIRIMDNSPVLLSDTKYNQAFNTILSFSEKNIWDRYEAKGTGSFYRTRTHMASHWARIGMELYLITGKQKYKDVFDNISHGTMPNQPSNLRDRMFASKTVPGAVIWDQQWNVSQGTSLQDSSHGGAIVSFIVNASENNLYWNQNDINALSITLTKLVWQSGENKIRKYVDGSGSYELNGRLHEWLVLGRYDSAIQNRIKSEYLTDHTNFFGTQALGIAALNQKILESGKAVYPEF